MTQDEEVSSTKRPTLQTRALEPFQYTSLSPQSNDIRLVTLLQGSDRDPIVVRIHHVSLPEIKGSKPILQSSITEEKKDALPPGWEVFETWNARPLFVNTALDISSWNHPALPDFEGNQERDSSDVGAPSYEALSYTWGSPKSRKAIFVDGPGHPTRKLFVTKNLAVALNHLRYRQVTRSLWIDAICINQQDIAERSAQVQKMPLIYRQANRVVAWLGSGSAQSRLAICTLQFLSEQVELLRNMALARSPDAVKRSWYMSDHELPYDRRTWHAILRLFERSWFLRVWIVQEVSLANSHAVVQCGNDIISWNAFRKASACLHVKRRKPSFELEQELSRIIELALFEKNQPYSALVDVICNRDCSDPRDRVYGLLGLISDGLQRRIVANYALSVEEIYKRTTLEAIDHFGRLEGFQRCIFTGLPRAISAPSWVPDLILNAARNPYSIRQQFSAGMSCCEVQYIPPNILAVSGLHSGVVTDVKERLSLKLEDGLEEARSWQPQDPAQRYPGGGTMLDAYAMTVGGALFEERFPEVRAGPTFEEWKQYFYGSVDVERSTSNSDVSPMFISGVEMRLFERTFFTTDQGYIGLGPLEMKSGDVISILLGYDAPMVLRQVPDGTYQIIGECLIYGFHDAICLLGPLPEHWKVQVHLDSSGSGRLYKFYNSESGQLTEEDPRLEPLVGWERVDSERTANDPEIFQKFKNLSDGEIANYDPRMSPRALRQKGVSITTFELT